MDRNAGGALFRSLYRRLIEANLTGAALAFVYLTFVAPPKPPPPHSERLLYIGIVPAFIGIAAVVGYYLGKRDHRPIANWLADDRPPTSSERARVLSLPQRSAAQAALGWAVAAVIFGVQTATHHPPAFVAGVVLGIVLAGLTSAAVTFLLCERTMRPVFARALAGEPPSEREAGATLGTAPRLLVSWALGSGVALVAIAVAFLGRGETRGDDLIGPVLFLVVAGLFAGGVLVVAAARSIADPVRQVRAAVERVEAGLWKRRSSSTTAARSVSFRRASTEWSRASGSARGSARRSGHMWTGTSPSTSCARALRSRARRWR